MLCSSLDQPLYFSYTCSVDESLPGFQFYQRQYYPADDVTREYLPYINSQPSSNVSPSSDGKIKDSSSSGSKALETSNVSGFDAMKHF